MSYGSIAHNAYVVNQNQCAFRSEARVTYENSPIIDTAGSSYNLRKVGSGFVGHLLSVRMRKVADIVC
jgi:hypothetical protein